MKIRRRAFAAVATGVLVLGVTTIAGADGAAGSTPKPFAGDVPVSQRIAALTTAEANIKASIAAGKTRWGDLDLRDIYSYKVDQLWNQGIDGSGTAVAVIEGWDDPGMQTLLNTLDAQVGLPDTTVTTIYPTGPLPATCPAGMVALGSYGSCDAWDGELELDVEAVHLMAPYAKIVISATPSDSEVVGDASSEVAPPEMMKALEYISANKLANVISISDGSSETDYSHGAPEILAQNPGEYAAAAAGIPVVNATGDCGAAQNLTTATRQCGTVSSGPASATWADSPFVTAVGGSSPGHTNVNSTAEDTFPLDRIEGAGLSEIYARPDYQDGIASITGSGQRSLPDITMDSRDGTSQAAPTFAGVLALATQMDGKNIGAINEVLYDKLGKDPAANGLIDVTSGNNTEGSIPGYTAGPGYDVASGWGTVDASIFVPALVKNADDDSHGGKLGRDASKALTAMEDTLSITPSHTLSSTATLLVTSTGFLPGHPVTISVDGTALTTVTADTSGNITYSFTAAKAGIAAGDHQISIHSMLLDQSTEVTITP